jgi:methenyltetrahydrofolate cyclohydrolase
MNYKDESLSIYLDDLASKKSVPGGGSAAALTASLGASLISMVINFTLGKPRYAKFEEELKKILEKSEKLRYEFLRLVDLDVVAYQSKNIRDALDVPFMVSRLCFEGIKLCPPLVTKGNVNLLSDVAIAAALLESGFICASFNVEINLKLLGDKGLTKAIQKELAQKRPAIRKISQDTEEKVGKIIRG